MTLTAIILTYNEAKHLSRCIESIQGVADRIVVADCFSTDATLAIARAHGARLRGGH
jgi:glycosyltransferase involved in cell wall biosynthesis